MTDYELASRIVALGIGRKFTPNRTGTGEFFCPPGETDCLAHGMNATKFVQDRRVVDGLVKELLHTQIERDCE